MAVWSEVSHATSFGTSRLDADFWQPAYLQNERTLVMLDSKPLWSLVEFARSGPFGSTLLAETYAEDGIIVLRPFNIKNMTLEKQNLVTVSERDVVEKRLHLYKEGDVLFARVGDVRAGIVCGFEKNVTISPNIIAVRPMIDKVNPFYLAAYMSTRFGKLQMQRALKTVAQPTITVDIVKNLLVPVLDYTIQNEVESTVRKAIENERKSEKEYEKAQAFLLSELELSNIDLSNELFCERMHSDTSATHRCDSEYYQGKYYRLIEKLYSHSGNMRVGTIKELSQRLKYGSSAKLTYIDNGFPFLRITELTEHGFDTDRTPFISPDDALLEKAYAVTHGDVLVSRSGTLGLATAIPASLDGAIFGSYFIKISPNPEYINSEYLSMYLNSIAGQLQFQRVNSGSIQTNLTLSAIEGCVVVYGSRKWQASFVDLLSKSRNAREVSRYLFAKATHIVEDAIGGESG